MIQVGYVIKPSSEGERITTIIHETVDTIVEANTSIANLKIAKGVDSTINNFFLASVDDFGNSIQYMYLDPLEA